jgi:Na+/melibiose symporter-like transporter
MLFMIFIVWSIPTMVSWTTPDNIPLLGGLTLPISMFIYLVFQSMFWAGIGILSPVGYSMMADVSEICKHRTGLLKDGGYGAMLSFVVKAAASLGLLISGYCLAWAGFETGAAEQSHQAVKNLVTIAFLGGAVISLLALISILKYPITRSHMLQIKKELLTKELRGKDKSLTRTNDI